MVAIVSANSVNLTGDCGNGRALGCVSFSCLYFFNTTVVVKSCLCKRLSGDWRVCLGFCSVSLVMRLAYMYTR